MVFEYDGGGTGKGGTATIFVDGEEVAKGRIEKTQPRYSPQMKRADVAKMMPPGCRFGL